VETITIGFHESEARKMTTRLRTLGVVIAVIGVAFLFGGGYAYMQVQDGYGALQSFSEAQNVTLSYNEDGQLVDRGTTEGAEAIMSLLVDDWNYPVKNGDLDPNDPLVNTASEYMYQMATISYHTLNGTQTVVLDEDVDVNGTVYAAGVYEVPVDGRYWTAFDRSNPLDAQVREKAWTGTAHGLIAELGVGTVTHSTLQMGLGLAGLLAGLGLAFGLVGLGMVWVSRGKFESVMVVDAPFDRVPEDVTV
jgi:hypothetical protein